MIRSVSHTQFAHAGDTVLIAASLIPKADVLGNFSVETANPGGWWGTAVQQIANGTMVPKVMQTPSFAGIVHTKEPNKTIKFKCHWDTWIRVVQYLSRDQVPSVSAKITIDTTRWIVFKRLWRKKKVEAPSERLF